MQANSSRRRAGFTTLELMLGLALSTVIVMAFALTVEQTGDAYRVARDRQDLQREAHRILAEIEERFLDSSLTAFAVDPSLAGATFRRAEGSAATGPVLGAPLRLEVRLEAGEIDDGADNNGDGLVDECALVLTEDVGLASEREFVVGRGVRELHDGELPNGADDNGNGFIDEPGLCFELTGNLLTIRLTLERMGEDGEPIAVGAETAVRIRN